jgi:hypothetical protein
MSEYTIRLLVGSSARPVEAFVIYSNKDDVALNKALRLLGPHLRAEVRNGDRLVGVVGQDGSDSRRGDTERAEADG